MHADGFVRSSGWVAPGDSHIFSSSADYSIFSENSKPIRNLKSTNKMEQARASCPRVPIIPNVCANRVTVMTCGNAASFAFPVPIIPTKCATINAVNRCEESPSDRVGYSDYSKTIRNLNASRSLRHRYAFFPIIPKRFPTPNGG